MEATQVYGQPLEYILEASRVHHHAIVVDTYYRYHGNQHEYLSAPSQTVYHFLFLSRRVVNIHPGPESNPQEVKLEEAENAEADARADAHFFLLVLHGNQVVFVQARKQEAGLRQNSHDGVQNQKSQVGPLNGIALKMERVVFCYAPVVVEYEHAIEGIELEDVENQPDQCELGVAVGDEVSSILI